MCVRVRVQRVCACAFLSVCVGRAGSSLQTTDCLVVFLPLLATFLPESLTITVSVEDNVNISFVRRKVFAEDAVIYKNGIRRRRHPLRIPRDFFFHDRVTVKTLKPK